MKIHDVKQGTDEWLQLRCGIPTASEFGNLVTPLWKVREGDTPATYCHRKLAEAWLGYSLPSFTSRQTENGQIFEQEAIGFAEFDLGLSLDRPGFITSDDGRAGCSPDALVRGAERGLEIKCPEAHTHVEYLLGNQVPHIYRPQVYGSMFVTGYPQWSFLSYRRGFPHLLITVEMDAKAQAALGEALERFAEVFDGGWQTLCRMNGGPPQREQPKASLLSVLGALNGENEMPEFEESGEVTP